jgi:hypothetical protein
MSAIIPTAPATPTLHLPAHQSAIRDSAEDLSALLASGAELPADLAGDALRLMGRIDDDLAALVERPLGMLDTKTGPHHLTDRVSRLMLSTRSPMS